MSIEKMGSREVAYAFYMTCQHGDPNAFDVAKCVYTREYDSLQIEVSAAGGGRAAYAQVVGDRVRSELPVTLDRVKQDYPQAFPRLMQILRYTVAR